jgi:hypothetical protein
LLLLALLLLLLLLPRAAHPVPGWQARGWQQLLQLQALRE